MNSIDLLDKDCMIMELKSSKKEEVIDEMIERLYQTKRISNKEEFKKEIMQREEQSSTGLGGSIAIPHGKSKVVNKPIVLFAKSDKGVDFEALDNQPVHLFFMIALPEDANTMHLKILSAFSGYLMNEEFVAKLKNVQSPEQVISLFQGEEEARLAESNTTDTTSTDTFVVAVTACPTGIAHTFMAADALKKKAKEMGIKIKVETNGSDGVQNQLTDEDIAQATGVIIAAGKNVEMARFNGKPLLNRPVGDGIRKTEELLQQITSGNAPIYRSKEENIKSKKDSAEGSIGSDIYKHLMNGVSHMLPFVIGGGIAIAIAFLVDQILGVPQDSLANLGSHHAIAAYFNTIGGAAFSFMLPVLAGFIGSSIADRPGLVTGFVAGTLASSGVAIGNLNDPTSAGFLGALLGGFLAGYVIVFLKKLLSRLPKSLEGIKTILFLPVFGVIIIGFIMMIINIPMATLNTNMNNFLENMSGANATLLGLLIGGMMAIDMGGPINKAAYVFGTGTLAATVATGGSPVMAAVMAGGMVPPLAIFVATLLFKNKFTSHEKESGITNLVMGLSFITEGAIPFAAADPLHVIPSLVVGSALAGGLVSAFNIRLMAPHGGVFVIGLVNKPLLYILFIGIGTLVSALILGAIKKPVK
jgi:PTS system fructose-specific IIC component